MIADAGAADEGSSGASARTDRQEAQAGGQPVGGEYARDRHGRVPARKPAAEARAVVTYDAFHTVRANLDCTASIKTAADIQRAGVLGLDQAGNIRQRVR